jgi:hypothetical protein
MDNPAVFQFDTAKYCLEKTDQIKPSPEAGVSGQVVVRIDMAIGSWANI